MNTSQTILVVDDEPGVLELVKLILGRQGYRILEADSGAKALEICERSDAIVDLLLTDVMMPGISGLALARRLKSLRQNLHVVYMTGGTLENLVEGELDPQFPCVRKPFDPVSLAATIRDALDAGRYTAVCSTDSPIPLRSFKSCDGK
jgi:two-component system, cell cycle sensor histidine kinase and response regulator CckA